MQKAIDFIKRHKWWILFHAINFLVFRLFYVFTIKILKYGSNIITFKYTFLFYLGVTILLSYLFYFIWRSRSKGIIVSMVIFSVLLISTEAILRFGVKEKLTYRERKGNPVYQSPYKQRAYIKTKDGQRPVEYLYSYMPNSNRIESCSEFTYEHVYNNEGIRDDSIFLYKQKNEIRILCLGDSYTEGVGTPQDSTWVQLLENQFKQKYPDKIVNCINGGIAGADPVYSGYLLQKLIKYQPDLVLLAINDTEVSEIAIRGGLDRINNGKANLNFGPVWEPFFAFSFIFRHLAMNIFGYTYELKTVKQMNIEVQKAYDVFESAINKIANIATANKATFAIILHPIEYEILMQATKTDSFVEHLVYTYNYNIIYILQCLAKKMIDSGKHIDKYYWQIDQHMNSQGYLLFSECVFNKLEMIAE